MRAKIILLSGDGIGPEVVSAARSILELVTDAAGHELNFEEYLIGGCAIDASGSPLPDDTLQACQESDAILLGAVGGPKWDNPTAAVRPEQGLLGLRKELDLYANLRPVRPNNELLSSSPLKSQYLEGVDIIVVRELTGGIYFGRPQERRFVNGHVQAVDTMVYSETEIERAAQLAFSLARERKSKLTSIDKANVLESSRLWREVVSKMAQRYPDIKLEHLLVDAAAMHLLTRPAEFDVMVTSNMFGDILTDEASVLTGSLGNLPSASLGSTTNTMGHAVGLYEPIHGSAPDIAGKGIANPIGTVMSAALLLRHSLGLEGEANLIEKGIDLALAAGCRTADLANAGDLPISTVEMRDAIMEQVKQLTAQQAGEGSAP